MDYIAISNLAFGFGLRGWKNTSTLPMLLLNMITKRFSEPFYFVIRGVTVHTHPHFYFSGESTALLYMYVRHSFLKVNMNIHIYIPIYKYHVVLYDNVSFFIWSCRQINDRSVTAMILRWHKSIKSIIIIIIYWLST